MKNNWKNIFLSFILYIDVAISKPQMLDMVAATVNDYAILESDIDILTNIVKCDLYNSGLEKKIPNQKILRQQVLDRLIMDKIILQRIQNINTIINNNELDKIIHNFSIQNNMTFDHLRCNLVNDNIDYNTYRTYIIKEILLSKICNNEINQRIVVLPYELNSLIKQIIMHNNNIEFNLTHIVISLPKYFNQNKINQLKLIINSFIEQNKGNINLNKFINTYYTDISIKNESYMKWTKLKELPVIFIENLCNVQKGSIVGPIRSGIDYHILKIHDIRGFNQKTIITKFNIKHILLKTSVLMSDKQVYTKLLDLSRQIKNGSINFDDAAKLVSEDPYSSNRGGDLGWNIIESFNPEFRQVLIHLSKNEISEPIHSFDGWHIIQLIDTYKEDYTYEIQKKYAYNILFNRKFIEEMQNWLQEQYASSYINIINKND